MIIAAIPSLVKDLVTVVSLSSFSHYYYYYYYYRHHQYMIRCFYGHHSSLHTVCKKDAHLIGLCLNAAS